MTFFKFRNLQFLNFLFFALVVLFEAGCSTTPSIQTRHKYIPPKRSEPIKIESVKNPVPKSTTTLPQPTLVETEELVAKTNPIVFPEVHSTPVTGTVLSATTSFPAIEEKKAVSQITFPLSAKKVGAILPMTGKNASAGQQALTAIRLGLGLNDKDPSFAIAIYDSKSEPDLAAEGVEKLLKDEGVVAILGGLTSKEAQSISAKAEFFQVPFFAFSQKSGLTDSTEYTFRNAITPEMQSERLVQFAVQYLKAKRFAILYPNDAYGVDFANKYWNFVQAAGGKVTAAQPYDPKDADLNVYIQKLVGTYFTDARLDEYQLKKQKILMNKKKKIEAGYKKNSRENEARENILDPVLDFDVLFVPDTSRALGQVIAFMKNNDVGQMTYLGTNIWNSSELPRRVGENTPNIFFVDSYVSTEETLNSDFHNKFTELYGVPPTILEAQIFEAAKIIKSIVSSGQISRNSLAYQLNILGRRDGAYSKIRMNNNHEIERPLSIFNLSQGVIQKVE